MAGVTNLNAWMKQLEKGSNGAYLTNLANITQVLRLAPELRGKLGLDRFSNAVAIRGRLPWDDRDGDRPIEDADPVKLQEWLQVHGINAGSKATVQDAMLAIASDNPFHPLQDYLNGLEWDGTARIDEWLSTHLGAADNEYTRAVGRCFLIAAVARAMEPGSKVDTMLVLEGEQGIGKSQTLQALAEPWVLEELGDMKSKDSKQEIQGHWFVEVSELDAMKRNEVETVKAFIAKRVDTYRPAYGRYRQQFPRQFVLVGTTNSRSYLRDHTGNRRFWPVRCDTVDLEALRRDRDQIWAEAVHRFQSGEQWWLTAEETALAYEEQGQRFEHDIWADAIHEFLSRTTKERISALDIAEDCLEIPRSQQNVVTGRRIAQIMDQAGWKRAEVRPSVKDKAGKQRRVYEWTNPNVLALK